MRTFFFIWNRSILYFLLKQEIFLKHRKRFVQELELHLNRQSLPVVDPWFPMGMEWPLSRKFANQNFNFLPSQKHEHL